MVMKDLQVVRIRKGDVICLYRLLIAGMTRVRFTRHRDEHTGVVRKKCGNGAEAGRLLPKGGAGGVVAIIASSA